MRFIVGQDNGSSAVYLITNETAVNLTALDRELGPDLMPVISGYRSLAELSDLAESGEPIPVAEIVPALPIQQPGKIICLGLNFLDHIKEGGRDIPEYPVLFMRTVTSLIPAGAHMVRPSCSDQLDYEAELMVIIGKEGKHISETEALNHVFGYTVFNDGSVRDYQKKSHQWTAGKNFDATGPIGPVIVTPDELPEGAEGLKIETRVGEEVLQSTTTSDMMWSVAQTIAAISEFSTLQPGDLLAMGTPPGVGMARSPQRWLRPGELVEVEIERICVCTNMIIAEEEEEGKQP